MVAGFSRSFSLPGSHRVTKTRPATEKSYHVRSISLPSRSHPVLSRLDHDIRYLASWLSTRPESASSSWISDGISHLDLLHASLADLLSLPQTQESLRRLTPNILDDFLRFADAHGSFRSEALALAESISEAHLALRRKDAAALSAALRCMKTAEKQIAKIASSLREMSKSSTKLGDCGSAEEEAELMASMSSVVRVTASASSAIFSAVAVAVGKGSWSALRRGSAMKGEEWRKEAMDRLEVDGEWIGALETGSERLYRCLINTRVSLLNIFTP